MCSSLEDWPIRQRQTIGWIEELMRYGLVYTGSADHPPGEWPLGTHVLPTGESLGHLRGRSSGSAANYS